VNIFFVPMLEVGHGIVSDLADKGVLTRYILFDGENISFDASLVTYINSTDIPPIMIINRI
jgi:hypothetical protein